MSHAASSPAGAAASTATAAPAAAGAQDQLAGAVERACARIAPTWPLDRFIAVNPFWGLVGRPLPEVAARLRSLSGAELLMPRAFYRQAYRSGALGDEHLEAALAAAGAREPVDSLRALLDEDEPAVSRRASLAELADALRAPPQTISWAGLVRQNISQFCAVFFDEGQATFAVTRDAGLYATWRRNAQRDRGPALQMGARAYRALAGELPATAADVIAMALPGLGVPERHREDYLWSLLLDVNGWASWCAYRRWTARLQGSDDGAIMELLAIRLAWDWMLYRLGGAALEERWSAAMAAWPSADAAAAAERSRDWLLQSAMEIAWRAPLLRALPAGLSARRAEAPAVQAVLCIDVRSEVLRRALESTAPEVQTLGFAGFFGLPIDYLPLGAAAARPQLPGLLAPRLRAGDTGLTQRDLAQRARSLELTAAATAFKTDAVSCFTFVEALGTTFAAKLLEASLGRGRGRGRSAAPDREGLSPAADQRRRPRLLGKRSGEPCARDERVELAAAMLRGMSLTRGFARLVLLLGHGSANRNNPHAAGLDCGACCGQTGEVNARAAAALLNDPEVREGLEQRGLELPPSTRFLAGLHDTTTDEVTLFELDLLPRAHAEDVAALQAWLAEASARARAERAAQLGLSHLAPRALGRALGARAKDWSQVRPEWGLANNAALIVAPREHCRHLDLQGRAFLHEYRHEEDQDHAILEQIMTAPLLVAHWINLQYYASTVDNPRYGSGNKALHNVVGGHLGVFEGNTGDLRIGLPLQSLHDGTRWVHTPLRLSVFLEAPRAAIDAILAKHEVVRQLVENEWISLFQLDQGEAAIYGLRGRQWQRASSDLQGARGPGHSPSAA